MGLLDKVKKSKKVEKAEKVDAEVKVAEKKTAKKTTKKAETKKTEATPAVKKATGKSGNAYKVMLKPHISEKSAYGEANGVYTFVVERESTKVEIKQAMTEIYGVTPKKVRVIHMDGKKVRFGRTKGRRKDWKKAIITLPKGSRIDIHAGV
jgi:large subunit ribosomal protein L23